jgi:hypothetical protein
MYPLAPDGEMAERLTNSSGMNLNIRAERDWPRRGDVQDVHHSALGTSAFIVKWIECLKRNIFGEMAERLNALVLKTSKGESPSRVRIPVSPPF